MIQVSFRHVPLIKILNEDSDLLIRICKDNIGTKDFLLEILLHEKIRSRGPYHELTGFKALFDIFPDLLQKYKSVLTAEELSRKLINVRYIPGIIDKYINRTGEDFILNIKDQLTIPENNEEFYIKCKNKFNICKFSYYKDINYCHVYDGLEDFIPIVSAFPEGTDETGQYHSSVEYVFRLALINGNYSLVKLILTGMPSKKGIPIMRIVVDNIVLLTTLLKSKNSIVYKVILLRIILSKDVKGSHFINRFHGLIPEFTISKFREFGKENKFFTLEDFLLDCFKEHI